MTQNYLLGEVHANTITLKKNICQYLLKLIAKQYSRRKKRNEVNENSKENKEAGAEAV